MLRRYQSSYLFALYHPVIRSKSFAAVVCSGGISRRVPSVTGNIGPRGNYEQREVFRDLRNIRAPVLEDFALQLLYAAQIPCHSGMPSKVDHFMSIHNQYLIALYSTLLTPM